MAAFMPGPSNMAFSSEKLDHINSPYNEKVVPVRSDPNILFLKMHCEVIMINDTTSQSLPLYSENSSRQQIPIILIANINGKAHY